MAPMMADPLIIEVFYNRKRRYSYLNQMSPLAFKQRQFRNLVLFTNLEEVQFGVLFSENETIGLPEYSANIQKMI